MIKTKSQKCLGKLAGKLFALPPSPILNRVESKLKDSRPVKTIKKEKYRFHYFIACSVEVTCIVTAIMLENMFWNIKSAVSTYGGIGDGEFCCWACMYANADLHKIFIYLFTLFMDGAILVVTIKNQPTN